MYKKTLQILQKKYHVKQKKNIFSTLITCGSNLTGSGKIAVFKDM